MSGSENSTGIEKNEARFEAAPIVLGVAGLQLTLALVSRSEGWKLWVLPWWCWLVMIAPEVALTVMLAAEARIRGSFVWSAIIVALNLVALVMLIGSILSGHETDGGQLLFKGVTVWGTDVVAFGLAYWELDRADDEMFQWPSRQEDKTLGPALLRLLLRLVHQLDRVQPDRRDAAHAARQAGHVHRVGVLGGCNPPRGRSGGEHHQVAA